LVGQGRAARGDTRLLFSVTDRAGQGLGNFRIWFSRHDFQDLGSQLWGLGNFRIWFSRLGISTLGPGFSHSQFPRPKPENF